MASRSFFFAVLMIVFAAAASAQDLSPSPAPAQMDAGAAYSLPVSSAVVGASLLVTLFAFLKH